MFKIWWQLVHFERSYNKRSMDPSSWTRDWPPSVLNLRRLWYVVITCMWCKISIMTNNTTDCKWSVKYYLYQWLESYLPSLLQIFISAALRSNYQWIENDQWASVWFSSSQVLIKWLDCIQLFVVILYILYINQQWYLSVDVYIETLLLLTTNRKSYVLYMCSCQLALQ